MDRLMLSLVLVPGKARIMRRYSATQRTSVMQVFNNSRIERDRPIRTERPFRRVLLLLVSRIAHLGTCTLSHAAIFLYPVLAAEAASKAATAATTAETAASDR